MRFIVPIGLAVLALGTAGCTRQTTASNDFTGAKKDAAQVVLDLSDDATRNRPADVCDDVLSERLQTAVAGDSSCISEVKKAFDDADTNSIEVDDVTIAGSGATVAVHTDADGADVKRTFKLVREDGDWRVDSFG